MPYGISSTEAGCDGWATVKQTEDGLEIIACHETKQDAVDQMVAASLSEKMEPLGDLSERSQPQEEPLLLETRQEPDLAAPQFMASSAARGLRLHEEGESGEGLQPQTVADARRMADGEISEAKWRKIGPWIARHIGDLDAVEDGEITPGLVAMLLWGGGSSRSSALRAQRYAERIVERLDAETRADAPAPKKDQIVGSDQNEPGSAQGKEGEISLSDSTEAALATKAREHNARMRDEGKPEWTTVRVGALRSVYRRGAGAFSSSHRPGMTRAQWALARVNAFLYLAENGEPENDNYVGDNDLLHPEHPRYSEAERSEDETMSITEQSSEQQQTYRWISKPVDDRRSLAFTNLEMRAEDGNRLVGYAAVFDSPSEPMPFTEFVRRGAFTKTLNDGADVRLLVDHEGVPLARTRSGTLTLTEDERGLLVEADLDPMNPDAQRVISAMRRGDLSQMSFAFRTIKDSWSADRSIRELREVQLYDVSVVTFPAYEETMAELRSAQESVTVASVVPVRLRSQQIAIARAKRSR